MNDAVVKQRNRGGRRFYDVTPSGAETVKGLVSVTTCIEETLTKGPNLERWAAKKNIDMVCAAAGRLYAEVREIGPLSELAWKMCLERAVKNQRGDVEALEAAGDKGEAAHKAIEHILGKRPGHVPHVLTDIEGVRNALASWENWYNQNDLEVWHLEKPVYSIEHRVAGKIDAVGMLNGQVAVIDWKTGGGIYPESILQSAAYCMMCEESGLPKPDVGVIVHCPKTEGDDYTVRMIQCEEMDANIEAFLAVLQVWKWKQSQRSAAV